MISIALAELPGVPAEYKPMVYSVLFAAMFGGCVVYYRALGRLLNDGGRVRCDLFGFADLPVLGTAITFFALSAASAFLVKTTVEQQPLRVEQIIPSAIQFALFPLGVLVFLVARNVSIVEAFGLRRVRLAPALGIALGFLVALLPLFLLVTGLAAWKLGKDAQLQPLVELYQEGVKQRDWKVILHTIFAAAIVAPIGEEVLFRGYFYAGLKRFIGAVPSGFFCALLFGAIHNNVAALPGLTLLALAQTVAYERSGSLVVPIMMHCLFNSVSLVASAWMALSPR